MCLICVYSFFFPFIWTPAILCANFFFLKKNYYYILPISSHCIVILCMTFNIWKLSFSCVSFRSLSLFAKFEFIISPSIKSMFRSRILMSRWGKTIIKQFPMFLSKLSTEDNHMTALVLLVFNCKLWFLGKILYISLIFLSVFMRDQTNMGFYCFIVFISLLPCILATFPSSEKRARNLTRQNFICHDCSKIICVHPFFCDFDWSILCHEL